MRRRSKIGECQDSRLQLSEAAAEGYLLGVLASLGIPVKAAYPPHEVCKVLNVKRRELRRMAEKFEPGKGGFAKKSKMIDSFMLLGNAEPGGYSTANIRIPLSLSCEIYSTEPRHYAEWGVGHG